jgi:hypothetical protein
MAHRPRRSKPAGARPPIPPRASDQIIENIDTGIALLLGEIREKWTATVPGSKSGFTGTAGLFAILSVLVGSLMVAIVRICSALKEGAGFIPACVV